MNWSIDLAPLVPWWALGVAAAVALALVAVMAVRRQRGASFRALALVALLVALANPQLREEQRDSLSNVALVVVDESTSQQLGTRTADTAAIKADLDAKLAKVPNLVVKTVPAGRPGDGGATGTNLFAGLNAALADVAPDRIAGVIAITDGQVHDVPKAASALGFDAPVHTILTGTRDEFDRRVEILKAPRYGIVGQSREIEVAIRETGKAGRAQDMAKVTVRREGRPDEIRRARIGSTLKLDMPFPHAGTNLLEIELEGAPGELTPANNRVVVEAEGVRENLRVLLVSGEPHAGERTWRNLLKSDAAVDLVHFTILRPPEKQDGTPINQLSLIAFPTRELFSERIKDFDLIIFDRYQHRGILQLLYYDNIARYVEGGGALLVAAGDDFAGRSSLFRTPLAPALPAAPTGRVIEMPFKPGMSSDGHKHPVTVGLAGGGTAVGVAPTWGRWFRQAEVRPSRGRVLMEGAEQAPLLIVDRKGKGRVALLTSDHAWLWARGFDGGGPHTDLLRRLSHWLMREPDLEEERLIASARGLQLTIERRSMGETVAPVTVSAPAGETNEATLTEAAPGIWRTTLDVKLPGLYKVQTQNGTETLTAVAHAGTLDAREMSEVVTSETRLKPLSDATGGGVFWAKTAGLVPGTSRIEVPRVTMMSSATVMAGSGWLGLKDREAYVTKGVKLTPVYTGFPALLTILVLLALAWWREGR
jgi:hypothetical protein